MPLIKRLFSNWLDVLLITVILGGIGYLYYQFDKFPYTWRWEDTLSQLILYDENSDSYQMGIIIQGLLMTLKIVVWATLLAIIVGIIVGIGKMSHILFFKLVSSAYVELIRNIPPLIFIFIFYFFISSQIMPTVAIDNWLQSLSQEATWWITLLFVKPELLENFIAGVICLALFEAAYIAEIVRGGLQSIDKGQWEASAACGMSWWQQMRLVILPQAIKLVLPPLAGQVISLVKDSSILSVISIQELTFTTLEMAVSTRQIFEAWIITAIIYFIICFCFSLFFRYLDYYKETDKVSMPY